MADTTVTLIGWGSQQWNGSYAWGQSPALPSCSGSASSPSISITEIVSQAGVSSAGSVSDPSISSSLSFEASSISGSGYSEAPSVTGNVSFSVSGVSSAGSVSDPSISSSVSQSSGAVSSSGQTSSPSIFTEKIVYVAGWNFGSAFGQNSWGSDSGVPSGTSSVFGADIVAGGLAQPSGTSATGSITEPSFTTTAIIYLSGWNSSSSWSGGGWGVADSPFGTTSVGDPIERSDNSTLVSGVSGTTLVSDPSISSSLSFVASSISGSGYSEAPLVTGNVSFSVSGVSSTSSLTFFSGWGGDYSPFGEGSWGQGNAPVYTDPQVFVSGVSASVFIGDPVEISSVSCVPPSAVATGIVTPPFIGADTTVSLAGFGAGSVSWGDYGWGQGSVVYSTGSVFGTIESISIVFSADSVSSIGSANAPSLSISETVLSQSISSSGLVTSTSISSGVFVHFDGWSPALVGWGEYPWGLGSTISGTVSISDPLASSVATVSVSGLSASATVSQPLSYSDYVYTFSGWNETFISWGEYGWGQGTAFSLYGSSSSPSVSTSAIVLISGVSGSGSITDPAILFDAGVPVTGVSSSGSAGTVSVSSGTTVYLAGWNANSVFWGDYGWGQGAIVQSIAQAASPSISADHTEISVGVSAFSSTSNVSIETNENISIASTSFEAVGSISVPEIISGVVIYLSGWGSNGTSWGEGDWGLGSIASSTATVSEVFADGIVVAEAESLSADGSVSEALMTSEVIVSLSGWGSDSFNWGDYGWGQGSALKAIGSTSDSSLSISEFIDVESIFGIGSIADVEISLSPSVDISGVSAVGSVGSPESFVETIVYLAGWGADAVYWGDGGWGLGSIASAIGSVSDAQADSYVSFEAIGVSGYGYAGDVSTLDEVTVYLSGWGIDSVSWGEYGWGQGAIATAVAETFSVDFAVDIDVVADSVSSTGSANQTSFSIDADFISQSVSGEIFVGNVFVQAGVSVFLDGWSAENFGWGESSWNSNLATSVSAVASFGAGWGAGSIPWGEYGWGQGFNVSTISYFVVDGLSASASTTESIVFVSESETVFSESFSANGFVGTPFVPGDLTVVVDGVSCSGSIGSVELSRFIQVSWLEVERSFSNAQVSWLEVAPYVNNVQVSWLFITPYVSVPVGSVSGFGQIGYLSVWNDVVDGQIPDWSVVPDSQNPNWNCPDTPQAASWSNIPGDSSGSWHDVNDSQVSIWSETPQSQTPNWSCSENSQVPSWMVLQDAQNSAWSCVNVEQGPNWECADSIQTPGWSFVDDNQASEWFQIAA